MDSIQYSRQCQCRPFVVTLFSQTGPFKYLRVRWTHEVALCDWDMEDWDMEDWNMEEQVGLNEGKFPETIDQRF